MPESRDRNDDNALTLLGLEPGADVRAIETAYIAAAKRCSPARQPTAFARLQAAYCDALQRAELSFRSWFRARQAGQLGAGSPTAIDSGDDSDATTDSEEARADDTPPPASTRATPVDTGSGPPGDCDASDAIADEADYFADDFSDWQRLVRTCDLDGLRASLDNPELVRLAADDPRYEFIALHGIAVIAWDGPDEAADLLRRFDPSGSAERSGSPASIVAQAISAARSWKHFEQVYKLPDGTLLLRYLRLRPALFEQSEKLESAFHKNLREHSDVYLSALQVIAALCPPLSQYIHRLGAETAYDSESPLHRLSPSQLGALKQTMGDIRRQLSARWSRYIPLLIAVLVVALWPTIGGIAIGLLIVGGTVIAEEGRTYGNLVRPRLSRLATDHGVGADHVVSWLYRLRREASKVAKFDIKIASDRALDLAAALGRSLTHHRRALSEPRPDTDNPE